MTTNLEFLLLLLLLYFFPYVLVRSRVFQAQDNEQV